MYRGRNDEHVVPERLLSLDPNALIGKGWTASKGRLTAVGRRSLTGQLQPLTPSRCNVGNGRSQVERPKRAVAGAGMESPLQTFKDRRRQPA
jgi:hypothetical protein